MVTTGIAKMVTHPQSQVNRVIYKTPARVGSYTK